MLDEKDAKELDKVLAGMTLHGISFGHIKPGEPPLCTEQELAQWAFLRLIKDLKNNMGIE